MDTREALIAATRDLLWERGYTATSPKAILQRAGAGQGSMYHHFSGKADLALAALKASAGDLLEQADQALEGPGPAHERLAAWLGRERDVLKGCRIGRLVQDSDLLEQPALQAVLAETFASLRRRLTAVLEEGIASGDFTDRLAAGQLAILVLSTLQGAYVQARAAGDIRLFDDSIDGIRRLLART